MTPQKKVHLDTEAEYELGFIDPLEALSHIEQKAGQTDEALASDLEAVAAVLDTELEPDLRGTKDCNHPRRYYTEQGEKCYYCPVYIRKFKGDK